MHQVKFATTGFAVLLPVLGLISGCDTQEIEQKHAHLQERTAAISAKFDERIALAERLQGLFAKAGCQKEKGLLSHLNLLRKKLEEEKFEPSMTSRVLVHTYQDLQESLAGTLHSLLNNGKGCIHGTQSVSEFSLLHEGITANGEAIANLYQQINSAIQEYNVFISVPPTSWENKLFFHFMVMHPWLIKQD